MGYTIVEKILSQKAGRPLRAGDTCFIPVDLLIGTDGTTPMAISEFQKIENRKVKDPDKVVIINDHFVPAKDIVSAQSVKRIKDFVAEYGIKHYYDVGRGGICHVFVPELGLIRPGDIVVGADSHTVTYGALGAFASGIGSTDMACVLHIGKLWLRVPQTVKIVLNGVPRKDVSAKDIALELIGRFGMNGFAYCSLEFEGMAIDNMDMSGRMTLCNMTVEMGAKSAVILPDKVTKDFCGCIGIKADLDAEYAGIYQIDTSEMRPVVACPYLPSNIMPVSELDKVYIDQVVIGCCTNGRYEDFLAAYDVLKNKRVKDSVRLIIVPGSQKVLKKLSESGILSGFIAAGAIISPPTCGSCAGCHMGVLADGEIGLFTTNRNFYGRNGHVNSKVYLSSPLIAAKSAVKGYITNE